MLSMSAQDWVSQESHALRQLDLEVTLFVKHDSSHLETSGFESGLPNVRLNEITARDFLAGHLDLQFNLIAASSRNLQNGRCASRRRCQLLAVHGRVDFKVDDAAIAFQRDKGELVR